MSYRNIAYATASGPRISGNHYIRNAEPNDQFMTEVHWDTMTVHVKVLEDYDANTWRTVSITPLDLISSS